jgi:transcriptional regulator with XRE-family HTH domain
MSVNIDIGSMSAYTGISECLHMQTFWEVGTVLIRSVGAMRGQVKAARLTAGWTQAQLAARIGATRQFVSGFEGGTSGADLSMILRLLDALGLTLDVVPVPVRTSAGARGHIELGGHIAGLGDEWVRMQEQGEL